jgi:hypothetical protein
MGGKGDRRLLWVESLVGRQNLCLRQQLLVLQRRHPRPQLTDASKPPESAINTAASLRSMRLG